MAAPWRVQIDADAADVNDLWDVSQIATRCKLPLQCGVGGITLLDVAFQCNLSEMVELLLASGELTNKALQEVSEKARPRWLNCIRSGDVDRVSLLLAVGVVASHLTHRASEDLLRSTIARGQEGMNHLFETTTMVQSIARSSREYYVLGAASKTRFVRSYDSIDLAFLTDILHIIDESLLHMLLETTLKHCGASLNNAMLLMLMLGKYDPTHFHLRHFLEII